jgi:hypothetical protein
VAGQGPGGQLLGQLVQTVHRGNAGFFSLHSRYAAQGVQFVGIGIDDVEKLRRFAKATPVAYPLLLVGDPAGTRYRPAGQGLAVHGGDRARWST